MKDGDEYYFYHNDHLGTPVQLTAVNGSIVWSSSLVSFGHASATSSSRESSNLHFPGQYFDHENGLYNNWYRYYHSEIGRYLSADPIGLKGGDINLFRYVLSNPINWLDSIGLFRQSAHDLVTADVLVEYEATIETINKVNEGNAYVDRKENFWNNNEHGICNLFQSREDAMYASQRFQNKQLRNAIQATMKSDYDKAFYELGQGLHSIQDEVAHDFIILPSHLPPLPSFVFYLYIDAFGNRDRFYKARLKSSVYVDHYIKSVGHNPFKNDYNK